MSEENLAARLVMLCRATAITITTAESCTGGLIAAAITSVPGSSEVFGAGFVTYSNGAKSAMLGVPEGLITSAGAVSEAVARRMASGAKLKSGAHFAVAVTGIAGPGGGSEAKPVGTVWFGLAHAKGDVTTHHKIFPGGRAAIRHASTIYALTLLLEGVKH